MDKSSHGTDSWVTYRRVDLSCIYVVVIFEEEAARNQVMGIIALTLQHETLCLLWMDAGWATRYTLGIVHLWRLEFMGIWCGIFWQSQL